jgi:nucleoporin NDC1
MEDRYGVVQRDIPQILEAFLSFLSAVEAYQAEINALYTPPPPDKKLSPKEIEETERLRVEVEKAGEILGLVEEGTIAFFF